MDDEVNVTMASIRKYKNIWSKRLDQFEVLKNRYNIVYLIALFAFIDSQDDNHQLNRETVFFIKRRNFMVPYKTKYNPRSNVMMTWESGSRQLQKATMGWRRYSAWVKACEQKSSQKPTYTKPYRWLNDLQGLSG